MPGRFSERLLTVGRTPGGTTGSSAASAELLGRVVPSSLPPSDVGAEDGRQAPSGGAGLAADAILWTRQPKLWWTTSSRAAVQYSRSADFPSVSSASVGVGAMASSSRNEHLDAFLLQDGLQGVCRVRPARDRRS